MIYQHFIFYSIIMAKKVEKTEECSCSSCNCGKGCCCGWKALVVLLAFLWVVAAVLSCIYSYKAYNAADRVYQLNVLSAGWEENFNKMNEVYNTDTYREYATEQTDIYVNNFMGDQWNTEDSTNNTSNTPSEDVKSIVEWMLQTSPIRWDANARFTIIEYTELLCPYCQRHSQEGTINSVLAQFPGEVNSISKPFIIHGEPAIQLANAMECVAELNPSVYHTVFEEAFNQYPIELPALISLAASHWVDEAALQACSDEWRYTQAVNDMMDQWYELFGVNWTPGNVIIDRETGKYELISWAYPVETFVETINNMKNS